MGGRIWVESQVGKGSVFHFTMCFGLQNHPTVRPISAKLVDVSNVPVLVVDDNATSRRVLEEILTGWHMRPAVVDNGPAGLAAMQRAWNEGRPFPLVLLDSRMPHMDGFALAEQMKQNRDLTRAFIMMLSSANQPEDASRCRKLGVAAYVSKPIKPSELLNAILTALGSLSQNTPMPSAAVVPPPTESQRRLRILLAEDNVVNQRLAIRVLEKRGYDVIVAHNGREALALLEKEAFDLVLMDVQLPEIDGFEATAILRKKEEKTGAHIPIIALTAHVMKEDQARCLRVGMDEYLSKPISADALFEAIERVTLPAEILE